ncbi:hypothetical protein E4U82_14955 [Lentibacillus salicampi]|uniref:Uncharacterized protein n=1 Tax=Lentibacillus salicampi TaxID=175306 RepID=A0A4Y9A809_9BACI|nr:hypothetical protein E4U82_14955 [Lentibacillus salicampi]
MRPGSVGSETVTCHTTDVAAPLGQEGVVAKNRMNYIDMATGIAAFSGRYAPGIYRNIKIYIGSGISGGLYGYKKKETWPK